MIDTRRTQVIDMPAVLSDLSPNAVALNAQAEIIRSRAVTGRVIEARSGFRPRNSTRCWMLRG